MNWVRDTWNQAEDWAVFPMSVGKLGTPCPFFGRDVGGNPVSPLGRQCAKVYALSDGQALPRQAAPPLPPPIPEN